ncbi:peptidase [Arcobacter sp. KX21116]|jgi:phage repressor protein C with HTH and peptisase S24 domain|uniref:S24 family peptidase n=1 Tax=Arcobacter iocasae TaxID=2906515 RepID=UPI0035D48804
MINLEYTDIFDDNKIKKIQFSKHLIKTPYKEKSLFAILVDGKSMEPVINHKAVIIADLSNKELEDSSIYLVYYENKMWVKKYDLLNKIFISINPDFSHLVYKEEDIHLVAKVILTFTTF